MRQRFTTISCFVCLTALAAACSASPDESDAPAQTGEGALSSTRTVRCKAPGGCNVYWGRDITVERNLLGVVPQGRVMGNWIHTESRSVVSWPMADHRGAVQYVDWFDETWEFGGFRNLPDPANIWTPSDKWVVCNRAEGCPVFSGSDFSTDLWDLGTVPFGRRMGWYVKASRSPTTGGTQWIVSLPMRDRANEVQAVFSGGGWVEDTGCSAGSACRANADCGCGRSCVGNICR